MHEARRAEAVGHSFGCPMAESGVPGTQRGHKVQQGGCSEVRKGEDVA